MLHSSYTMCTCGLPDIYTLNPQACSPQTSGVYIRQTTHTHGIIIKYPLHKYTLIILSLLQDVYIQVTRLQQGLANS